MLSKGSKFCFGSFFILHTKRKGCGTMAKQTSLQLQINKLTGVNKYYHGGKGRKNRVKDAKVGFGNFFRRKSQGGQGG